MLDARPAPPGRLEAGDLAVRHESGGVFLVEDAASEQARADAFEISPTGPIFGPRMRWPAAAVAERERAVLREAGLDPPVLTVAGVRARGARRALRVRPEDVRLVRDGGDARLDFRLPAGSYATVMVRALFAQVRVASDPPTQEPPSAVC